MPIWSLIYSWDVECSSTVKIINPNTRGHFPEISQKSLTPKLILNVEKTKKGYQSDSKLKLLSRLKICQKLTPRVFCISGWEWPFSFLTVAASHSFPYVKKRILVVYHKEEVLTPIEVAIDEMTQKVAELEDVVNLKDPDVKKLQLKLQGSVSAQVLSGVNTYCMK